MLNMLVSLFLFAVTIAIFWGTERCRRNPENCKDSFMTQQGWTRSPFAIKYLGKPEDARDAIVRDSNLRRKHIMFSYGLCAFFFLMSLVAYTLNVGQ